MKRRVTLMSLIVLMLIQPIIAVGPLEPIESVSINANRAIAVNGKPFFPIMIWLQDPDNFVLARGAGINTVAGYWPGSGGTKDVVEYLERVKEAGLYSVLPFDERLKGNPSLLTYIHGDEPDLPRLVSKTEIEPAAALRINNKTPLWKVFDGVTHSWSVLDPLEGARFTLKLKQPVEVQSLAVWLTVSKGLSVAKEISFLADGREVVRMKLKNQKGQQKVALKESARFQELTCVVRAVYPGEQVWGSIGEIQGCNKNGKNVLCAPPEQVPRKSPAQVQEEYENIKTKDASRPVCMTLTGYFLPVFSKWSEQERERLYPNYVKAADIIGYDIYPIYGWNKPEWLHLVHDGTEALRTLAGDRPVYAWIETSRGGQWTGDLDRQKRVTATHIRGEVWMAICRGATAIGYFTHVWKPTYRQFGVPPENVKAMKDINDQITRLAPAILAKPAAVQASIAFENGLRGDILAKDFDGHTYVFAVNYDSRQEAGRATIKIPGLRADTEVEVVDEDRTISSATGSFTDQFGPLGVHIYRIEQ